MPGFELIGEEERAAVNELFDDGGIMFRHGFDAMRNGRYRAREFEDAFAAWLGADHGLAVSSGTAALRVALAALRVGPGDEVITQAHTFVATVEAIIDAGAKPVLVDVDETLNMDPAAIEAAITDRTKAILPVDMLGVPCDWDAIGAVAQRHGLALLDDNCEALGSEWGDQKVGVQADVAAFSLDMGKVITCGEGGVVVTSDPEIAALAREYHDHGHENLEGVGRGLDTARISGFNFRLSDLQGAVALAQLRKLDDVVAANRRNHAAMAAELEGVDGLTMRPAPAKAVPLDDTLIFSLPEPGQADAVVAAMGEAGLGTKNIPDALNWHFAGRWGHMCEAFGLDEAGLRDATAGTWARLSRSVAVPIMVRMEEARAAEIGRTLAGIVRAAVS